MIEPQAAEILLNVANHSDNVANQFKAAKYFFSSQRAEGFACFAKKEAMEHWRRSECIRKYVLKHDGVIAQLPALGALVINFQGINECLVRLKQLDGQAVSVVQNAVKQLAAHDMAKNFLCKIGEDLQKDYQEVADAADHTGKDVSCNILTIDTEYLKRYTQCGK